MLSIGRNCLNGFYNDIEMFCFDCFVLFCLKLKFVVEVCCCVDVCSVSIYVVYAQYWKKLFEWIV